MYYWFHLIRWIRKSILKKIRMAGLEIGWTKSGSKYEICTTTFHGRPFFGFQTMHSPMAELTHPSLCGPKL